MPKQERFDSANAITPIISVDMSTKLLKTLNFKHNVIRETHCTLI